MKHDSQFEYLGNIHVHSYYSDGAGSIFDLAEHAQNRGLDFIVCHEHAHMTDSLHLEMEGFYHGLVVLMGLEIGIRCHHYLGCYLKEFVNAHATDPQKVIDRVNSQGGFGFLAHPFEKGMPFFEKSVSYTWNDLNVSGFTGIEIWNFSSRWKERVRTLMHGIFCLLFKTGTLQGPSQETLELWDRLCAERRIVAVGGSDAHGALFNFGPFSFTPLSYEYLLNSINVHIIIERELSADFSIAKHQIYSALKDGRLFIAHDNLASAKGFRFYFTKGNGESLAMGEEIKFEPGILTVESPGDSNIRIVRNGELIIKKRGIRESFEIDKPGVYRVEVFRRYGLFGWRPWIFSNPIYLR